MERLSIKQVAKQLHISKDTLRYYDKLELVSPKRGENNYRYYTGEEVLDLQYILILRFTGFTLPEISEFFQYMKSCDADNFPLLLELIKKKKEKLVKRVIVFQSMIEYFNEIEVLLSSNSKADVAKINSLAMKMFQEMKKVNP